MTIHFLKVTLDETDETIEQEAPQAECEEQIMEIEVN